MGQYYIWFLAGSTLYLWHKKPCWANLLPCLPVIAICATWIKGSTIVPLCIICALFTGAVLIPVVQRALSIRSLLFLGFVSYPLYLLHENAMVAMIVQLGRATPIPLFLLPVIPIATLVGLAWLVARFLEPRLRTVLTYSSSVARTAIIDPA
jgi:peptidoglycan/LPS O-acetylase OafA/YrhL